MSTDRGRLLKDAVEKSDKSITDIAEHLEVDRSTIYNWFNKLDIPIETMLKIGKFIRHDFIPDIENSKEKQQFLTVQEAVEQYNKPADFKEKYFHLLEEQNKLLREDKATYEKLLTAIYKLISTENSGIGGINKALEKISKTLQDCIQHTH